VRQLYASRERLRRACDGLFSDDEQKLLYQRDIDTLESVRWGRSDLPVLDEAEHLLNGTTETYGHVVIDEAQDLTPMQLRMVARRSPSCSLTVLGDVAQATGLWAYRSWEEITEYLGAESVRVEQLTTAYRVPRQIMAIALPVARAATPEIELPVPVRDGRSEPEVSQLAVDVLASEAVRRARALASEGGLQA
jgi:DNA helicase IV